MDAEALIREVYTIKLYIKGALHGELPLLMALLRSLSRLAVCARYRILSLVFFSEAFFALSSSVNLDCLDRHSLAWSLTLEAFRSLIFEFLIRSSSSVRIFFANPRLPPARLLFGPLSPMTSAPQLMDGATLYSKWRMEVA